MSADLPASPPPDPDRLRLLLRQVVDPEIGLNIVDLGLVYGVEVAPARVRIALTMTSPACPLSDVVIADVEAALAPALPETWRLDVDLVWEPPWEPSMIQPEARAKLGWS